MKPLISHIQKNRVYYLLLLVVFVIGVFLRFNHLSSIPNGLYQDETAIGYNAYSILKTGKDEHGVFMPLYFKSFGDYKLPVYIYLTAVSIRVFGLNAFAVRFPSAFFGSLEIPVLFGIVLLLTKRKDLAIITALFLAFNPWQLFFSRAGFEVNVAAFFISLGVLLFILGIKQKKEFVYFVFSLISFILATYCYNVTRILAPLILFTMIAVYFPQLKQLKSRFFWIVLLIVLAIPYILTLSTGAAGTSLNLIIGPETKAKIFDTIHYLGTLPTPVLKLFYNNKAMIGWQYIQNIASFFSPTFFFTSGSPHGNQGIGNFGNFYPFDLLFVVVGVIAYFRKRDQTLRVFIAWAITTIAVVSLSTEVPHGTRAFLIVMPITIFSAYGAIEIFRWIFQLAIPWKVILGLALLGLVSFSLVFYFSSYYVRFPQVYAQDWRSQDRTLVKFIQTHKSEYDRIYIDKSSNLIYTSLLFYSQYSPAAFQKSVVREPDNDIGYEGVQSFGKYIYKDVNWSKDFQSHTLIITSQDRAPRERLPLKLYYYPNTEDVLVVNNQVMEHMKHPVAYEVFSRAE